MSMDGGIILN